MPRAPITLRLRFATNLRRIRIQLGISQETLGDAAGLHRSHIGSVERGETNISIDNMERLAKSLHVEISELFEAESNGGDRSFSLNPRRAWKYVPTRYFGTFNLSFRTSRDEFRRLL